MKATRAAGRYGNSLLQYALEQNQLEAVKADAETILNAIKNSKDLRNLLTSPVIKPVAKTAVLKQIFADKISDISQRFITLVVNQKREGVLDQIYNSFVDGYREHNNILLAEFTTATAVPESSIKSLKSKLEASTGKTVEIKTSVNPDLIGGFVVEMANYKMDASIAAGIKKMKRELSK